MRHSTSFGPPRAHFIGAGKQRTAGVKLPIIASHPNRQNILRVANSVLRSNRYVSAHLPPRFVGLPASSLVLRLVKICIDRKASLKLRVGYAASSFSASGQRQTDSAFVMTKVHVQHARFKV